MPKVGYQRHDMERISKTLYGESDVEEKKKKKKKQMWEPSNTLNYDFSY